VSLTPGTIRQPEWSESSAFCGVSGVLGAQRVADPASITAVHVGNTRPSRLVHERLLRIVIKGSVPAKTRLPARAFTEHYRRTRLMLPALSPEYDVRTHGLFVDDHALHPRCHPCVMRATRAARSRTANCRLGAGACRNVRAVRADCPCGGNRVLTLCVRLGVDLCTGLTPSYVAERSRKPLKAERNT